jgi:gluconokinase
MVIVVIGVEGSGKTTIGKLLAERWHSEFADADDFHSAANKEKMSKGIALRDADRWPWLGAIRQRMLEWIAAGKNGVMTCSALKQSYRDFLVYGRKDESAAMASQSDQATAQISIITDPTAEQIKILYLHGDFELIDERLKMRSHHFAGENLLRSQFATLEAPHDAVTIEIDKPPEQVVDEAMRRLKLNSGSQ